MSQDPQWIADKKYNGSRVELHALPAGPDGQGKFLFYNRHGQPMRYTPNPEMAQALAKLPLPDGYCLFDGELRHNKVAGVRHRMVLFDVFIWDGELQTEKTFRDRRLLLEYLTPRGTAEEDRPITFPSWFHEDFERVFTMVTMDPEIEGPVMKYLNGKLAIRRTGPVESNWMWKVRKASGRYRF